MKLILFLIIVIIIYLIASQIKVVHLDTFPFEQQKELNDRSKIRSMLLSNYIKSSENPIKFQEKEIKNKMKENFGQVNPIRNKPGLYGASGKKTPIQYPDTKKLFSDIVSKYLKPRYNFNISNLPVTTKYSTNNDKYLKYIRKDINGWNKIFAKGKNIIIDGIKPIFVMETENEFIIKTNVKIVYFNRNIYLQLTYYGIINNPDDIFSIDNSYFLQLIELKPISWKEYNTIIEKNNPFMEMEEQMAYVQKVNKMHAEEF